MDVIFPTFITAPHLGLGAVFNLLIIVAVFLYWPCIITQHMLYLYFACTPGRYLVYLFKDQWTRRSYCWNTNERLCACEWETKGDRNRQMYWETNINKRQRNRQKGGEKDTERTRGDIDMMRIKGQHVWNNRLQSACLTGSISKVTGLREYSPATLSRLITADTVTH